MPDRDLNPDKQIQRATVKQVGFCANRCLLSGKWFKSWLATNFGKSAQVVDMTVHRKSTVDETETQVISSMDELLGRVNVLELENALLSESVERLTNELRLLVKRVDDRK